VVLEEIEGKGAAAHCESLVLYPHPMFDDEYDEKKTDGRQLTHLFLALSHLKVMYLFCSGAGAVVRCLTSYNPMMLKSGSGDKHLPYLCPLFQRAAPPIMLVRAPPIIPTFNRWLGSFQLLANIGASCIFSDLMRGILQDGDGGKVGGGR